MGYFDEGPDGKEEAYLDSLMGHVLPLQQDMLLDEYDRDDVCPSTGKAAGRLLHLLILATRSNRALELGTSMGYSAIWMGLALQKTGGSLVTIESHARLVREARRNIERAGLADTIRVLHGDAKQVLEGLEGDFDFILQDAGSASYPQTLCELSERLAPGGLLVADDILFALRAKRDNPRTYHARFNQALMEDENLFTTLLSMGNGLSISLKKDE